VDNVDLLSELFQLTEKARELGADAFGPHAAMVNGVGQLLLAGLMLFLFASGRSFWAPPTPQLSDFAVKISSAIAGAGIAGLLVWSRSGATAVNFLVVTMILMGTALVAAIVYFLLRLSFCFQCEHDPETYVRGFWLNRHARRVLNNDQGPPPLPAQYVLPPGQAPPPNARQYFSGTKRNDLTMIWTGWSRNCAFLLLFLSYVFLMVPFVLALASAAYAVSQPQLEEKQASIELPADVLFDFDKSDIRPGAVESLKEAAAILRKRNITAARIEGHTDSKGTPEHNLKLSQDRAESVRKWLVNEGGLGNMKFTTDALGATRPVADNLKPDGADNPAGRQKNRRVAIVFNK
jgi:outer membrane protein OmpA-like peptidoglycan-associated protein